MPKGIGRKLFISYIVLSLLSFPVSAQAALTKISGVPTKSIEDVLGDATDWLIGFGISICVLMIIWGGVNYVGSTGNQDAAGKAKKTISYAIWGLLIIGLSYALIKVIDEIFT